MTLCEAASRDSSAPASTSEPASSSSTGRVCFVDYEYSQFGPPQFDVANHFAECASPVPSTRTHGLPASPLSRDLMPFTESDVWVDLMAGRSFRDHRGSHCHRWCYDYNDPQTIMDWTRFPSPEQRAAFVSAYLGARARHAAEAGHEGESHVQGQGEEVAEFLDGVDCFLLVVHLLWVLWGLVQARVSAVEGFDYTAYSLQRLGVYARDKAALLDEERAAVGGKNRYVARATAASAAATGVRAG